MKGKIIVIGKNDPTKVTDLLTKNEISERGIVIIEHTNEATETTPFRLDIRTYAKLERYTDAKFVEKPIKNHIRPYKYHK